MRPAMVERKEVEDLLAYVEMKLESDKVELPPSVSDATLAALCRAWLAVQDAPEVGVREASFSDGHRIGKIIATADTSLIGQRVRIVKEVEAEKAETQAMIERHNQEMDNE